MTPIAGKIAGHRAEMRATMMMRFPSLAWIAAIASRCDLTGTYIYLRHNIMVGMRVR